MVVADLRPKKERLRVEASKTVAETADSPPGTGRVRSFDSGRTVRWYAADSDDLATSASRELAQLWRREPETASWSLSHGDTAS